MSGKGPEVAAGGAADDGADDGARPASAQSPSSTRPDATADSAAGRDDVVALVERAAALEARVAALHAEQVDVLSDLLVHPFVDEHDIDLVAELAARCRWTAYTANRRLACASRLAACFPLLLADLAGGELDLYRVQVVLLEADLLDDEQARVLDALVAGTLVGLTSAQIKALVRAHIAVIDSDAVRERARRVLARRRVEFTALEDGAASLQVVGPAEAVRGVYDRLDALARDTTRPGAGIDPCAGTDPDAGTGSSASAGAVGGTGSPRAGSTSAGGDVDGRGIDAKRFDACVELLLAPVAGAPGVATGTGPQIHIALSSALGLDDLPAHLSGCGPIPAERVRQLLSHTGFRRVITEPLTGHVVTVDGHTFPAGTLPDLSGIDLSGIDLSGIDIGGSSVEDPDLGGPDVGGLVIGTQTTSATPRAMHAPAPPVPDHAPDSPRTIRAQGLVVTAPDPDDHEGPAPCAPGALVPVPSTGSLGDPGPGTGGPGGTDPDTAEASDARSSVVPDCRAVPDEDVWDEDVRDEDVPDEDVRDADVRDEEIAGGRRWGGAPQDVPDEVEARDPGPGWVDDENGHDSGYDPATDDPADADPAEGPRDSEFTVTLDIARSRPSTLVGPQIVSDPGLWTAAAHHRARAALRACPTVASGDRTYRFSAALRRYLTLRSPRCTAPGCRAPAHRCDLDHTTDHAHGGPTCPCNTGPLCRRHHRTKHARGWVPTRTTDDPRDPTMTWLSPLGYLYTVPAAPLLPTTPASAPLVHAHLRRRRRAAAALEATLAARPPIAAIHAAYAAAKAERDGTPAADVPEGFVTRWREHTTAHLWKDGCRECEPEPVISLRPRSSSASHDAPAPPLGAQDDGTGEDGRQADLGDPPF